MIDASILQGISAGLLASGAWAVANVLIQRAARAAGPLAAMFWGQVTGAVVLLAALPWWPAQGWPPRPGWILVGGLASILAYVGLFRAFAGGPVSVTSPIVAGWALISTLFGILLFGERLYPLQGAGAAVVIVGSVALAARSSRKLPGDEADWHAPRSHVIAWSLGSCVGFGVMVAAIQPIAHDLGPVAAILVLWGTQWAILGPALLWKGGRAAFFVPRSAVGLVIGLGLFETVGFVAVDVGTLVAPVAIVSPPASLGSLLTVLLGWLWLREQVGLDRLFLALVIVAGVVLLGLG